MYQHKDGVEFRKVTRDDLSDLLALKEDWWGTHSTPILNIEDQEEWYDSLADNELVMIAKSSLSSQSIGVVVYNNINRVARTLDISGSIYADHRHKTDLVKNAFAAGLDFAFEILNMHRVNAEVLETNFNAFKLETKYLGFKVEGRKRQAVYKSGRYYDSFVLGMLRSDWMSQNRVAAYEGGCCCCNFDHTRAMKFIGRTNNLLSEQATHLP